jgi:hypothetical protein
MSVNNNTPYTDNSQIHTLIENILSTESPARSFTGRELCHGPIVDLSGVIPLGAHISQRIKEKIWNNEFMNLADLLPKLDFEDPWSVTLGPSLITMSKQSSKSRGPLTFYEWNEAFHIYMAIYIERFPSEAPNMLKYMSIVKDAYEMRGTQAFRTYDQSFRLLRARNNLPWQKPIDELFTKSVFPKRHYPQTFPINAPNKYVPPTINRRSQPFLNNRDRDGTCHVWNTYEVCNRTNCTFKHVCKFCRGPHPKVRCTRQPNTTQGPQQPKHTHINRLPSPIKSEVFARELSGYDPILYKSLLSGFREGFKLGVEGEKLQCNFGNAKNRKSALENPDKVLEKLAKESLKSRIAGPFKKNPLKKVVCSPLGLVTKTVIGKFRLIHDLSYPKGNSVNSLIPP